MSLEGGRRGALGAPRLLTARTLHFPLCFLFTCKRKNNRSSCRRLLHRPPRRVLSASRIRTASAAGGAPSQVSLEPASCPSSKQVFFLYKGKQPNKDPKAHKPPRLPHSHTRNFHSGQRKGGGRAAEGGGGCSPGPLGRTPSANSPQRPGSWARPRACEAPGDQAERKVPCAQPWREAVASRLGRVRSREGRVGVAGLQQWLQILLGCDGGRVSHLLRQ